jgi:hypothetical protein
MGAITIRLDKKIEDKLEAEIRLEKKTRSQLLRTALEDYLRRREQGRMMQALIQEMQRLPPTAREESIALAEEALPLDNEALDLAEGRKPGEPWLEEKGERWWK